MWSFQGYVRWISALIVALLVVVGTTSCGGSREAAREAQVKKAFESCKQGLINHQTDQVMACIPRNADDYLARLNTNWKPAKPGTPLSPGDTPGVDLLLATALEKKVPADLRPKLTLAVLMQRIMDEHLLSPHEVEAIDLGRVSINGNKASAELYYQGTLTALRLPFVKEDGNWKVDIMAILPYAEVLMRLDRAIKGETEDQQVEFLVSKLPSL